MKVVLVPGTGETVELTAQGTLRRIRVYKFMLDDLGPFTHQVPVDQDTEEALRAAIDAQEKKLTAVQKK